MTIKVLQAKLRYNHDLFLNQDPFCIFFNKDETGEWLHYHQTAVINGGGKSPVWDNEVFFYNLTDIQEDLKLEMWDEDTTGNDFIGSCFMKIGSFCPDAEKGPVTDWFSLFSNNERVGVIQIQSQFQSENEEDMNAKHAYTVEQQLQREVILHKELQAEIEESIKQVDELESRKVIFEEEYDQVQEEKEKTDQLEIQYSNYDEAFIDDSFSLRDLYFDYTLQELKLNPDSTAFKITASHEDRKGSVKSLLNGSDEGTWMISDFQEITKTRQEKVYMEIIFNEPILIRAVAVGVLGQNPSQQPRVLEVHSNRFPIVGKDKTEKCFKAIARWRDKQLLQPFAIETKLITRLILRIKENNGGEEMQISQFKIYI